MLIALRHHPKLTKALIFSAIFVLTCIIMAAVGLFLTKQDLDRRVSKEVQNFSQFSDDLGVTIRELQALPHAAPCSEAFLNWMRRVAFLPDGIHEIIYAPGNRMLCSVSTGRLDPPVPLSKPDFVVATAKNVGIWLDRDLSELGFPGLSGTFVKHGDFILVVPKNTFAIGLPDGYIYEIANQSDTGALYTRQGTTGLLSSLTGGRSVNVLAHDLQPGLHAFACDVSESTCLAMSIAGDQLIRQNLMIIVGILAFSALLAGVLTSMIKRTFENIWSLSSRFRRQLSSESIVCHYQPLVELAEERIWGVEVLARWRDDDGQLVYPDVFLPVVEKHKLHRKLTRLVVDQAYKDLFALPMPRRPLKVHFNIFPCEFEVDWMLDLFEDFLADNSRFEIIVELVESDALPIDSTRKAIARLRGAGIRTFIDDFGEGYSSIGYLAGLGSYGVKLDRSFGQAPEGSLMESMLSSAIDMVSKTGQVLVVEGVETANRLAALKNSRQVAIVQGYFISRPVSSVDLNHIFAEGGVWDVEDAA